MLAQMAKWNGAVEINGKLYDTIQNATSDFKPHSGAVHIKLYPRRQQRRNGAGTTQNQQVIADAVQYKIFVKQYMTKKADPAFDFMAKWNNDNPMPYRIMIGEKVKETRGMVYMKLHADITEKQTLTCMCCGRKLTNPVSQYFGVGPECGNHNYVNPFNSDEELRNAVASYREQLRKITWEGWIIKSAIITEEVVDAD